MESLLVFYFISKEKEQERIKNPIRVQVLPQEDTNFLGLNHLILPLTEFSEHIRIGYESMSDSMPGRWGNV